jgi:hypothetical protein
MRAQAFVAVWTQAFAVRIKGKQGSTKVLPCFVFVQFLK